MIKKITSKYTGYCARCYERIDRGAPIYWDSGSRSVWHEACYRDAHDSEKREDVFPRIELSAAGATIEAYSDLVVRDDSRATLLLSVWGRSESLLKALAANFLESRGKYDMVYRGSAARFWIRRKPGHQYRVATARVGEYVHSVVYSAAFAPAPPDETGLEYWLIRASDQTGFYRAVYERLRNRFSTPLLEAWTSVLLRTLAVETNGLQELSVETVPDDRQIVRAYSCSAQPDEFDRVVSDLVRAKKLEIR